MNKKIKNVAVYCRVSTEMQEESDSLQNQINRCKSYCEAKGYNVVKVYSDVESGAKDERKEFQELMNSIGYGVFQGIVVTEISRVSRKMSTLTKFMETLQNTNMDFISITQDIDTSTLMGKTFFNLLGVLSEFERGQTRERVTHTLRNIAKNGRHTGGVAPFGYKLENKKLIIEPDQALKVVRAYDLYISGHTRNEIIKELGIPATSLNRMLITPFYTGIKTYNIRKTNEAGKVITQKQEDWLLFEGQHEAIIDKETYKLARALAEKRKKNYRKVNNTTFLLKGLLKCYNGHNMYWTSSGKFRYYKCYRNELKYDENNRCTKKGIVANEIEKSVIEYILSLKPDFCNVNEKKLNNEELIKKEKIEVLELKLEKLKDQDGKLINLLLEDIITSEEFTKKKREISKDIYLIEEEREGLREKSIGVKSSITNKELFFKMVEKLKSEKNLKKIEHILHLIIYEIRFINDFEYKIVFNI